jgi:small subunit ribosomal protein S23
MDKILTNSSVVQRQLWLMKHRHLSQPAAYDVARREFYKHRHLESIRQRVAREEALHVGAYFGKGPLEIGMELEDKSWENWKTWARRQIEDEEAQRAQMFSGPQTEATDLNETEYTSALNELDEQGSVPHTKQPQTALGGAAAHP